MKKGKKSQTTDRQIWFGVSDEDWVTYLLRSKEFLMTCTAGGLVIYNLLYDFHTDINGKQATFVKVDSLPNGEMQWDAQDTVN